MSWKEHIKNVLVGAAAFMILIILIITGEWLRAHDLQWIVLVPVSVILLLIAFWGVGFMIRSFMEEKP